MWIDSRFMLHIMQRLPGESSDWSACHFYFFKQEHSNFNQQKEQLCKDCKHLEDSLPTEAALHGVTPITNTMNLLLLVIRNYSILNFNAKHQTGVSWGPLKTCTCNWDASWYMCIVMQGDKIWTQTFPLALPRDSPVTRCSSKYMTWNLTFLFKCSQAPSTRVGTHLHHI